MKNIKIILLIFFLVTIFNLGVFDSFGTGGPPSSGETIEFKNPLDYDTVEDILTSLLNNLRGVIVIISIIFIVIGALLYITSTGNENRVKSAKLAITASMIGLAIGIAAPSFLKEIAEILDWKDKDLIKDALTIKEIALNTLGFLLGIVGIFAIIMLVVGGIAYFGAGINEKQAETAKKIILYSIIGIAVAMASLVIVKQIAEFFNVVQ